MNYLRPSSRVISPLARLGILAAAALALILILVSIFIPTALPAALHALGRPLWQGSARAELAVSNASSLLLRSKGSLIEENQALREKIATQELQLASFTLLRQESDALKALWGRRPDRQVTIASVLARPNLSLYDTVIVDAGTEEGILVGKKVFTEGDMLVGTIDRMYAHSAVVKLFSTPGERTVVEVGAQKIQITAEGRGAGNFQMQLPRAIEIREGDTISVPGITPKLFGVVEKVRALPADPFQTVLFKSPFNIFELRYVFIEQ